MMSKANKLSIPILIVSSGNAHAAVKQIVGRKRLWRVSGRAVRKDAIAGVPLEPLSQRNLLQNGLSFRRGTSKRFWQNP